MATKEMLEKIELTFKNLGVVLAAIEFDNRCQTANYNTNIALNAIKEFSARLELTGEEISSAWNDFMYGENRMAETLIGWKVLDEKMVSDVLENHLLWLVGKDVIEKGNLFGLIKVRI